ncbi:MAG: hypothetical protein IID54_03955 [Proteobacteria bacterium]|nr:hypothetical protein [Pseudomonadota bacterium]
MMSKGRRRQQGNMVVAVSVIGLSATFLFATLMNHTMVLEQTAVENELAEVRAYWAVRGHHNYALSRIRHSELCGKDSGCNPGDKFDDNKRAITLQAYLDEIADLRIWTYPDENANYRIGFDMEAEPDDTPGRNNHSGHLIMTSSFNDQSTLPILDNIAQRLPPVRMRLCVGMDSMSTPCGPIDSDNGGYLSENFRVKRLVRLAGSLD